MNKLKRFLSDKRTDRLVLILSIISRTIQIIFFYNIRVDRSFQLMAMQNLINGHGITISKVVPSNLADTIYEPLIKWPPGYSLLISPFYLLFNKNYILCTLAIDIVFAILLIVICRKILKELETPGYLISLFTLLAGFFLYDFYVISSSDGISTTVFLFSIYYTLLLLKNRNGWIKNSILLSLCLLSCGLLKYLLIPAIVAVPIFLLVYGLFNNNAVCKKASALIFILIAIGEGFLLLYQKKISGSSAYISQTGRGLFPENLLGFYPFLPASFIKPVTIEMITHWRVDRFFRVINLILAVGIFAAFVRSLFKNGFKTSAITRLFVYVSFVVSLAIILLLAFLSLYVAKEQTFPGVFWSYVEEPRYYGPVIVLLQLSVFACYDYWMKEKIRRYAFFFFALALTLEIIHGLYFDFKRISVAGKEEYSWQYEDRFQKYADRVLKKGQEKYNVEKAVVAGPSYYMNNRIGLYSHVPIMSDSKYLNQTGSIKTTQKILLMVVLPKNELQNYQQFLSTPGIIAGQFGDYYFYTIYVQPN